MIIMALDYVREFVHSGALRFSAEDLAQTTVAIFFTRWITHICAPVFMFTAGVGAFLRLQQGRTKGELARFLSSRGAWLLLLEITVVRFAMTFNLDYSFVILEVIWALGCCMILFAASIYLPVRVFAFLSIAMIALHNLTDGVNAAESGRFGRMWTALHQVVIFHVGSHSVLVSYPLVPWVAVMCLGFCFGRVLLLNPLLRRKWMIWLGAGLSLAFIMIRAVNLYGDPVRWTRQATPLFTVLSFLKATKYPPSLDFLLMTLGPALLLLAWFDRRQVARSNPLLVFGRVPLFFFVVHLFAIHGATALMNFLRYGNAPFLFATLPSMGGPRALFPPDFGYPLWAVYLVWVGVVVALYPICGWFADVKARRDDWWLSYL